MDDEYDDVCDLVGEALDEWVVSCAGIRGGFDALVSKALELGISEGEIERIFQEALQ